MKQLEAWENRPPEEAYLFNPAFCASLTYEFTKAFERERSIGVPLPLVPIALAVALHPTSRQNLPGSTITVLYEWLQKNNHLLVGFADRVENILPRVLEGVQFGILHQTLTFGDGYFLKLGIKRASFTPKFLDGSTNEMREIVDKTRFLGRWFVKAGTENSIMSSWGVMP